METKPVTIKALCTSGGGVIVVELVANLLMALGLVGPLIGIGLARLLQLFVVLFSIYFLEKDFAPIGIDALTLCSGFKKGLLWSLGFGIIAGIGYIVLLLADIPVAPLLKAPIPRSSDDVFLYIGIGTILGPVAEELFFRGVIYGFCRQWGFAPALFLSTVLFVLPHMPTSGILIPQLIGGLVFAFAYEMEKNLMVPIVIHCLGNSAIFSLALMI